LGQWRQFIALDVLDGYWVWDENSVTLDSRASASKV
jgi:hypothetical protein